MRNSSSIAATAGILDEDGGWKASFIDVGTHDRWSVAVRWDAAEGLARDLSKRRRYKPKKYFSIT